MDLFLQKLARKNSSVGNGSVPSGRKRGRSRQSVSFNRRQSLSSPYYRNGQRKTVLEQNKFYASTTLAGFGFIQRSNSRVEVIIWYLIIITFSIITVYNVTDLTNQYLSQTTVTRVSIGRLNSTYNMSHLKLRVRIGLPELNNEYRPPYSLPGVAAPNYSHTLASQVDAALARLDTREKFLTLKWDYVLLPLMTQYGFYISACELFNEYCNQNYQQQKEFQPMTSPQMAGIRKQVFRVLNHSAALNISDQELLNEFGRQILGWLKFNRSPDIFQPWKGRFFGILPSYQSEGSVLFLYELKPSKEIGVGLGYPNGLCLRTDVAPIIEAMIESKLLGPNVTLLEDGLAWYNAYKPEMMLQYGLDSRRNLKSSLGQITFWSVEVKSSFHSISNCQSNNSKLHCTHECTARQIQKLCNCFPILFDGHKPPNVEWCRLENYRTCLSSAKRNIHASCGRDCVPDCDMDFLDVRSVANIVRKPTAMELCMNVLQKEIPVFHEHYSQNFQNFMAELGGAVDFWLGASVLALVHLLVYVMKQVFYSFRGNTKTGQNIRKILYETSVMDALLLPKQDFGEEDSNIEQRSRNGPFPFMNGGGVAAYRGASSIANDENSNSELAQAVRELKTMVQDLAQSYESLHNDFEEFKGEIRKKYLCGQNEENEETESEEEIIVV